MENPNSIETKGLLELANNVEVVSYKLSSIRDVAELIAERLINEPESGATWAVSEMLEVQERRLEQISEELMNLHRERHMQNAPKPQPKAPAKKAKKK